MGTEDAPAAEEAPAAEDAPAAADDVPAAAEDTPAVEDAPVADDAPATNASVVSAVQEESVSVFFVFFVFSSLLSVAYFGYKTLRAKHSPFVKNHGYNNIFGSESSGLVSDFDYYQSSDSAW